MIWREVARSRARMLLNALRSRSQRGPGHPLLGLLLAVVLALLVSRALAAVFAMTAASGISGFQAGTLLGLLLTGLLVGLLVFDLHEAVSTLIADSDLELLRRAPIRPHAMFLLKLGDALPRTSMLIVVLGIPGVFAFHVHFPVPLWGWALLVLQLASLWAIPVGLGVTAAIRLLCVVPAKRAREVLGLISTMVFVLLWLANSFVLPRVAGMPGGSGDRIDALLAAPPLALRLSPGHWAGQSLAAAAAGSFAEAVTGTVLLLIAAAAALALANWTATRDLETAQARISAGGGTRRPHRATRSLRGNGFLSASVARDLKLLIRDWSVMSDVLTGVILWTLLPLVAAPLLDTSALYFAKAMLVVLAVALGYEIAARLIPIERGAIAWCRLAPVPVVRWIAAKFVTGAALSLTMLLVATASLWLTFGLSSRSLLESLAVTLPALLLSLSIGLWTGAAFGRTDWKNPRAMLGLAGRLMAMVLLVGQTGMWMLFLLVANEPQLLPVPAWTALLVAPLLAVPILAGAAHVLARREI